MYIFAQIAVKKALNHHVENSVAAVTPVLLQGNTCCMVHIYYATSSPVLTHKSPRSGM